MKLNDRNYRNAVEVMSKLLWGNQEDRSKLQDIGINIIPVNFYSNIPSISETLSSFEYFEEFPYLDSKIFDQKNYSKLHTTKNKNSSLENFKLTYQKY